MQTLLSIVSGVLGAIRANDGKLAREVRRMDDVVDDLYTSVKLYLTQISREALDERESRRWAEIMSFTINLEHVGDIIERAYAGTHLDRLAWQTPESIETSSLHLDIINDFKRISSHFCAIAYPILEGTVAFARTRLREEIVTGSERADGTQARHA